MKREILAIALLCSSLILGGCGASNATSTNTDQSSKAATEEPKKKYEEDLENTTEIKSYWLTYAQAIEWAEDNLGEAETLQIFGCHGEGGTASLNLQIDRTMKAKLQSEASRRGVTLRALVEDMISRL